MGGVDPNTGAPVIPDEFKQYNSYEIDPQYQWYLTWAWTAVLAASLVLTFPRLAMAVRNGRLFNGLGGVRVLARSSKSGIASQTLNKPWHRPCLLSASSGLVGYPIPFLNVSLGQALLVACFTTAVLVCVIYAAPLRENPNRAGFIAVSLLPTSFLFAQKSPLITLLLSESSYVTLNVLHRYSSRLLVLCGIIHGSLWINNRLAWNSPILTEWKESLGLAALGFLCVLALSSFGIVRRRAYKVFWLIHILSFPSFFILVCYHTPYAQPWIYPPIAFYLFDLLYRSLRFRVSEAHLFAVDNQMTLIHLPYLRHSWRAGQFFNVRIFKDGMDVFETHSLTCMSAPVGVGTFDLPASAFGSLSAEVRELLQVPDESPLKKQEVDGTLPVSEASLHSMIHINKGGMFFGARVCGDWTRRLNEWTAKEKTLWDKALVAPIPHVQTLASVDGPYGGLPPSFDLGQYQDIILLCGGSGITFGLACLDEVIGRAIRTRQEGLNDVGLTAPLTTRAELVWIIRGFGAMQWFSPHLMRLALAAAASDVHGHPGLDLHITVYVTCLCDPDSVPAIPNMDVRVIDGRPNVVEDINRFLGPVPASSSQGHLDSAEPMGIPTSTTSSCPDSQDKVPSSTHQIGLTPHNLGIAASGPRGLVTAVQRWVAETRLRNNSVNLGYHGEVYAI